MPHSEEVPVENPQQEAFDERLEDVSPRRRILLRSLDKVSMGKEAAHYLDGRINKDYEDITGQLDKALADNPDASQGLAEAVIDVPNEDGNGESTRITVGYQARALEDGSALMYISMGPEADADGQIFLGESFKGDLGIGSLDASGGGGGELTPLGLISDAERTALLSQMDTIQQSIASGEAVITTQ